MRHARFVAACVVIVMLMPLPAVTAAGRPGPSVRTRADTTQAGFDAVVSELTSLPYQPAYAPIGTDSAFPGQTVLNTLPAQDYTTGSIPGSPDAPNFPSGFNDVELHSADGAPFFAQVVLHAGQHPGIVVVHGFNTHGKQSVVRWAAMLAANGYNVIAADQRDFAEEYQAGKGYPTWRQTYGWKEAQDIVAAGQYLAAQPGVTSVGIVGFSEGAQDTVLAMARSHVFAAGITFSGPADQDTQQYSTAAPPNCSSPNCSYPATDALVAAVVPPYTYTNTCDVLAGAAKLYGVDGFGILAQQSAFHAQTSIQAPLLNFYAADDPLVPAFQARMMAGYEQGAPLQRTLEIQHGAHAYYYDRWWQQEAILRYFKDLLPDAAGDAAITIGATVNQTPGGTALQSQLVDLGAPTRAQADAYLAPYICDTSRGSPAAPPANGGGGDPTATPEPGSGGLYASGLAALLGAALFVRRRRAAR